jgi:ATP-dependent Zn protease
MPFPTQERHYSEETAREIDCAVRELTDQAREKALAILTTFREELEESAARLLEKETLLADELPRLDASKLTVHKRASYDIEGQSAELARDGDEAGITADNERPR